MNLISRLQSTSGIRRAAGAVFVEEMREHLIPVLGGEIAHVQRDAEPGADRERILAIGVGAAGPAAVVLFPVLHEHAGDRHARALQQQRRDRRIDAARHADDDRRRRHRAQADAVSDGSQRIASSGRRWPASQSSTLASTIGLRRRADSAAISSRRQPERAHDAVVERARSRVMADRHAAEREAHELAARFGVAPLLHAEQAIELDVPAGLFERLAHGGVLQRLVGIEVPGRLVEHDASADVLLDEQKASVARHDGCDRHMWTPYDIVRRQMALIVEVTMSDVRKCHDRKSTGARPSGGRRSRAMPIQCLRAAPTRARKRAPTSALY